MPMPGEGSPTSIAAFTVIGGEESQARSPREIIGAFLATVRPLRLFWRCWVRSSSASRADRGVRRRCLRRDVACAVHRTVNLAVVRQVGIETALTTAFIFGIFLGATAFALVMRSLGGDELSGIAQGPAVWAGRHRDLHPVRGLHCRLLPRLAGDRAHHPPAVAPVVKDLGFNLVWFVVVFRFACRPRS